MSLNEFEMNNKPSHTIDNLSFAERRALQDFKQQTDLIIKPADKGGNIVLMKRSEYVDMCMCHLNDISYYRILSSDPTSTYVNELETLLHDALNQQIINQDELIFLLPNKTPTIATFYCLPKIHKGTRPPPGRPIVSGNNCLTEALSKFVEKILHPLVLKLPSYITGYDRSTVYSASKP
ncbi:Hypothetical predicted protein [Pelobates cultripes]|uniref:Uncharacterized protein n=1 Tax=Pelobates cultripes TaxID=61616 RepID=A0AAD1RY67_PELCU|nr:Hypothetical predicted protein [Pelobates cultripes]